MKPYYQDNSVRIYNGHVLDILPQLKPESIQCCVTSPPYWGLRDYGLPPQIWDDPGGCEHLWGDEERLPAHPDRSTGNHDSKGNGIFVDRIPRGSQPAKAARGAGRSQGQFCQLCGAWRGSLGLEPTPELYIQHIVQVFREVKRVLRKDGTLWLNLGDSYASGTGRGYPRDYMDGGAITAVEIMNDTPRFNPKACGLKPKDLCGIPWAVAFALRDDGWWLRSDNIWNKLNPMPESVNGWRWERHRVKIKAGWNDEHPHPSKGDSGKSRIDNSGGVFKAQAEWQDCPGCLKCTPNDGFILRKGSWRPTRAHEYVFLLTKSDEYFADGEAVKEENAEGAIKRFGKNPKISIDNRKYEGMDGQSLAAMGSRTPNWLPTGRNLRSVWTIATEPTPEAHFATFPEKLVIPCIKAGTSEKGCCPECGAPWVRVVEKKKIPRNELPKNDERYRPNRYIKNKYADELREGYECGMYSESKTIGWKPSCECGNPKTIPCTVCDPFSGSGKVGLVAKKLDRKAILVELKQEYCDMPIKKLAPQRFDFHGTL